LDSLVAHSDSLSASAPIARMLAGGGIALRMRWNSADPPVTMTATKIERTKPSPALFAVPPGYERF
jgi:hypothetical protein